MKRILATAVILLLVQSLSAYAQTHFERMNRGDSVKSDREKDSNNPSREKISSASDQNENRSAVREEKVENIEKPAQGKPGRKSARQPIRNVSGSSENNSGRQGNLTELPSNGAGPAVRLNRPLKSGKTADQINRESQGRKTGTGTVYQPARRVQGGRTIEPASGGSQGRTKLEPSAPVSRTIRIPDKVRKMGITKLPPAFDRQDKILRTERQRSTIPVPSAGPKGKPFSAKLITPKNITTTTVRTHMDLIVRDKNFHSQITRFNASEMKPGRYYWHTWDKGNYCHYYDHWGYHWYGWNVGSDFFWTRYYNNNWWWYDPGYDRWCYWYNGWWWWPSPTRVVYVYNNGNYSACSSAPDVTAAPPTADEGDASEVIYRSKGGNRMIKIMGNENDAFLYDISGSPSFKPVYLASDVKKAKFGYRDGALYQVVLLHNDGTYSLFDPEGYPYQTGNDELE